MTDPIKYFTFDSANERIKELEKYVFDTRRRERLEVAARIMAGMHANEVLFNHPAWSREGAANDSVLAADALLARIDKEPADE